MNIAHGDNEAAELQFVSSEVDVRFGSQVAIRSSVSERPRLAQSRPPHIVLDFLCQQSVAVGVRRQRAPDLDPPRSSTSHSGLLTVTA